MIQHFLSKSKYLLITAGLICTTVLAVTQIQSRTTNASSGTQTQKAARDTEVPTADDPWEELEKIIQHYYVPGGMHYEGMVKVIDASGEEEKVLEQLSLSYSMLGETFHYRLGTTEVVSKKELLLLVDHRGRTISYFKRLYSAEMNRQVFDVQQLKALLQQRHAEASISTLGGVKILTIDGIQDPTVQGYRIYYHPATYRLQKFELGMNRLTPLQEEVPGDKGAPPGDEEADVYTYFLEVTYAKVQPLEMQREAFRPEDHFIQVQQNSIQLTPSYQTYTLLNEGE